jgi:hypothetical protein
VGIWAVICSMSAELRRALVEHFERDDTDEEDA